MIVVYANSVDTDDKLLLSVDGNVLNEYSTDLHTPLQVQGLEWVAYLTPEVYEAMHEFMLPMDKLTQCKEWCGKHDQYGYPVFHIPGSRTVHVSRIVLFEIGRVPDWDRFEKRWEAHHTCFNRGCVNPYHLMWCTPKLHKELHMIANEIKSYNGNVLDG